MEPAQPRPISKTNDPINRANADRRREEISTRGGKICRSGHELPAVPAEVKCKKRQFYWVFHHGTALAQMLA
jgi:hypothetical protein